MSSPSSPSTHSTNLTSSEMLEIKFRERARVCIGIFLSVLPLHTTDSTVQKLTARRQWKESTLEQGLHAIGLQNTSKAGTPSVVPTDALWRAAPAVTLCASYSPHHQNGVHSKQIRKLLSLQQFTTASSYLNRRHRPFRGSLLRAEYIFKNHRSLPSLAIQKGCSEQNIAYLVCVDEPIHSALIERSFAKVVVIKVTIIYTWVKYK